MPNPTLTSVNYAMSLLLPAAFTVKSLSVLRNPTPHLPNDVISMAADERIKRLSEKIAVGV